MQGRLLPPVDARIQAFPVGQWELEFPLAAAAGLSAIEWIFEVHGAAQNPLGSDAGIASILANSRAHGVAVESLCADWFMDRPLLRASDVERTERLQMLLWLIGRAALAGIRHVILPFVDASAIQSEREANEVVSILREVLVKSEGTGVEIHLETALAPGPFASLLERLPHALVRANYDTGNSASLGYQPQDEFVAYGPRIGSVHVKDRLRGGGTVALGTGDTNFAAVQEGLRSISFNGLFTLQVAREASGRELDWALQNRLRAVRLLS
jgi:hexulose-6-phosphate isomerase